MESNCYCASYKNGECDALDIGKCVLPCNFSRTAEQDDIAQTRTYARLRTLPEARQRYISIKYYNGKLPWM
jgi:translation elongation factor EF-Tu-like GTPase